MKPIWLKRKPIKILLLLTVVHWAVGCRRIKKLQTNVSTIFSGNSSSSGERSRNDKVQEWAYFKSRTSDLEDAATFEGKLEASERIEIRSDKRARISSAKFKVGDTIKRGSVLFVVDTNELKQKRAEAKERLEQLQVDVKTAKAQNELAEKQFSRKTALLKKGIIAKSEAEEAQKQFVTAESALKTKELELRKASREFVLANDVVLSANFISPIDGIVASIAPGGDEAQEGQVLAVIINPTELNLAINVDETKISKFKVGQKVSVVVDAAKDKNIDAVVKKIDVGIQEKSALMNSYKITSSIASSVVSAMNLREGYGAKIRAFFAKKKNVLTVPKSSVAQNGKDAFVLVAESPGSSPVPRPVKLGLETDLEVEIIEGIRPGQLVATAVRIAESQKP